MTIICGIHVPRVGTWLGSDSQVSSCGTVCGRTQKWITAGLWRIGLCGYFHAIQLASHHADELSIEKSAWDLAIRFRSILADDGYTRTEHVNHQDYGSSWLIASAEGLWACGGDGSALPIEPNMLWADGSGYQYAIGAGHATAASDDPEDRVRKAVAAACAFDVHCGGEANLEFLPLSVE